MMRDVEVTIRRRESGKLVWIPMQRVQKNPRRGQYVCDAATGLLTFSKSEPKSRRIKIAYSVRTKR